jgi:hypothetical protein
MAQRWWIVGIGLSACTLVLAGIGAASGEKDSWQTILPRDVYQELVKREISLVQNQLENTTDERSLNRAKFGALLIAALTKSVKDGPAEEDLRGTREMAITLVNAINKKEQLEAARKLAVQLSHTTPVANGKPDTVNWRGFLETPVLMVHFLPKPEGGDGIHTDLQSNALLKGSKNGILEKIRYLSTTELTAANLESEAKELELLGYRSAVIGSLIYYLVPAKMKPNKTAQQWQDLAIQMRDQSVNLAVGAQKRDATAVLKASASLRSACSRCHNVF